MGEGNTNNHDHKLRHSNKCNSTGMLKTHPIPPPGHCHTFPVQTWMIETDSMLALPKLFATHSHNFFPFTSETVILTATMMMTTTTTITVIKLPITVVTQLMDGLSAPIFYFCVQPPFFFTTT
ncbi:hypothetical protein TRVL_05187 [Trypanosoma vivax]|nr:hypothetical protein TRVL_05187 [Trypanosoma vivax]